MRPDAGHDRLVTTEVRLNLPPEEVIKEVSEQMEDTTGRITKAKAGPMNKRVLIASALGLVFGVLNWLLAVFAAPKPLPRSGIAAMILGRALLGFVIGNSAWRMNWWLHGLLLGFIVSLPAAFAVRLMSAQMAMSPNAAGVLVLVLGMVIGFL
ncbi:MAG: hypothetical protein HY822_15885, partial [Acidobacteria bacterium]|nr:hypothetical protein [Acidobacteriota bacterium]